MNSFPSDFERCVENVNGEANAILLQLTEQRLPWCALNQTKLKGDVPICSKDGTGMIEYQRK